MEQWVRYLKRLIDSVRSAPLVSVGCLLSVTVCLLLLGVGGLLAHGAGRAIPAWMSDSRVVVYLQPETPAEAQDSLAQSLKRWPEIRSVMVVGKEEAIKRLQNQLGPWMGLLDGLQSDSAPPSLELRFKESVRVSAQFEGLINRIREDSHVDEVLYAKGWTEASEWVIGAFRVGALLTVGLLAAAVAFSVFATTRVKLLRGRKAREIYRAFGATSFFLDFPHYLEAGVYGAGGAVFVVALLAAASHGLRALLPPPLTVLLAFDHSDLFVWGGGLVVAAVTLCTTGSWLALSRPDST